jgi:hypothetical protein
MINIKQNTCIIFLKLVMKLGILGDKINLTGSGEVSKILGSRKLPRQLEYLPDSRTARFRKLGCHCKDSPVLDTSMGRGNRLRDYRTRIPIRRFE